MQMRGQKLRRARIRASIRLPRRLCTAQRGPASSVHPHPPRNAPCNEQHPLRLHKQFCGAGDDSDLPHFVAVSVPQRSHHIRRPRQS